MSIAEDLLTIAENVPRVHRAGYDKAESDFWDGLQNHGNRTYYGQVFRGAGFEDILPKYSFENAEYLTGLCMENPTLKHFGEIKAPLCPSWQNVFQNCISLQKVDAIDMSGNTSDRTPFANCISLSEIKFFGIIPATLNMGACPLSKESLISVVNALSSTATGQTLTLKKISVNNAFTDDEWNALIGAKTNWKITLS